MLCFLRFLPRSHPPSLSSLQPVGWRSDRKKQDCISKPKEVSICFCVTDSCAYRSTRTTPLPHRRCTVTNPPSGGLLALLQPSLRATPPTHICIPQRSRATDRAHTHGSLSTWGMCFQDQAIFFFPLPAAPGGWWGAARRVIGWLHVHSLTLSLTISHNHAPLLPRITSIH